MGNEKQPAISMGSKSCDEWLEQHPDSNCKDCVSEKFCEALAGSMIGIAENALSVAKQMIEDAQTTE